MKLRFLSILFLIILPFSVLAMPKQPLAEPERVPNALIGVIEPSNYANTHSPGTTFQVQYRIYNFSNPDETFDAALSVINQPITPIPWPITIAPNPLEDIAADETRDFIATITVPAGTPFGSYAFAIRANLTSVGGPSNPQTASTSLTITVAAPTATPTATSTATATPTQTPTIVTGTPTLTPGPVCDGNNNTTNDDYEPDNDPTRANPIEVDVPQEHAMCPVGDEDWVTFGGLSGKVYTIDISQMVNGLDLSLTLYDEYGNQLAYNDDYYLRNNDPTDLKPRIQSWRAPRNGQYYIKIRDAARRGFVDGFYTVELVSESYGPTPTLIGEICQDLFEPDGLPDLAPLMVVGEIHDEHTLCPRGDADWVKFFGKAGKSYALFTSELTVGADTVMVLTDRDGTTILDFNDDFGTGLASRIDFRPEVDGFYYAQIKNIGEVGNQFITYKLTFQLTENANGGDGSGGGGGGNQPTTLPTDDPFEPTEEPTEDPFVPTDDPFVPTRTPAQPTNTLAPGVTPSPTLTPATPYPRPSNGNKLPDFVISNAGKFIDPSFAQVWEKADAPIAGGVASRSWLWGPQSRQAQVEVYSEAPGGLRQVQYFDKSRMEINNFSADRNSQWFVTNGLLAKELITGKVQLGDESYANLNPAQVNIAGDLDDTQGPTYASFSNLMGAVENRTGSYVNSTLTRSGKTATYNGPQHNGAQLVHYVPETGHNIAAAFWDFMNRQGPVSINGTIRNENIMDWVFALGYPVSEPYWTRVKVGGVEQNVLVQAFERRVLTYTPSNPADWQVEMGNVGQHYHLWRYGKR